MKLKNINMLDGLLLQKLRGERYYLRLLLMNIRGPKSYEALRTVDGRCYTTFREAAEKMAYYILITT
ncbi:hypothetical protein H5410_057057 [Solanum commersonii]|uniref:Uncharacterized protein n=1 Tax=Solanum commersonii TaxID=4109 RepID=A0A9J5WLX2_SOLCO|nr:hypothetical protein H5410_057057 [Solanum commersonii]